MKHIRIILPLFVIVTLLFGSCTKEVLQIIDEPIEIDENSVEYQQYLFERARTAIALYRFEKVDGILDRITEPSLQEEVLELYNLYKTKAKNEGLFIVEETTKDSLYFLIIPRYEYIPPAEATSLYIIFDDAPNMINARGALQGFKNYPKLELLSVEKALPTEVIDLEKMPNLKSFKWSGISSIEFETLFPSEEFEFIPLQADLSKNHQLEEINVSFIESGNITFPNHQLENISIRGKISQGSLDGLKVKEVLIIEDVSPDENNLIIKDSKIDNLTFKVMSVENLNIAESDIKSLNMRYHVKALETLQLNEGLEELYLSAGNLKERLNFPNSLKNLTLSSYPFDPDFSALTQLDSLIFSQSRANSDDFNASTLKLPTSLKHIYFGSGSNIITDGMQLPESLESIRFDTDTKGNMDLSYLPKLKEVAFYNNSITEDLKLPASVEKVDMQFSVANQESFIVDLSHLTNIYYLRVQTYSDTGTVTLILPETLTEQALMAPGTTTSANIFLKTGSTIVNAPVWLDKYVKYY